MYGRLTRASLRWLLVVAFAALVLPASSLADAKLGISPLKVNLSGAAGSTLTTTISLSAQGTDDLSIRFAHLDFGLSPDYSIVLISDAAKDTTAFSTRNWFSVPHPTFRIRAGATVNVPVRIHIPRNTPGGTYLGIASFVSSSAAAAAGQIRTSVAAGAELFIAVDGGSPPKPRIATLDIPRIVATGPIQPRLTVTNDGDDYFALEGSMRIDGSTRGAAKLGEQYVLPHQPRTIRTSSTKKAALLVGTSSLGIGRHELTIRMRISPTNSTIVAHRTFWVIPAWIWLLAAITALVLFGVASLGIRWLLRRRRTRALPTSSRGKRSDPTRGPYDSLLGVERPDDDISDDEAVDDEDGPREG